mmetsp:Transcript_111273/g.346884  ORF Transcript_111273/g.346884 Transcript_111273/m.346884 type:complete len:226 (-) Transcript_111273:281-958(-)
MSSSERPSTSSRTLNSSAWPCFWTPAFCAWLPRLCDATSMCCAVPFSITGQGSSLRSTRRSWRIAPLLCRWWRPMATSSSSCLQDTVPTKILLWQRCGHSRAQRSSLRATSRGSGQTRTSCCWLWELRKPRCSSALQASSGPIRTSCWPPCERTCGTRSSWQRAFGRTRTSRWPPCRQAGRLPASTSQGPSGQIRTSCWQPRGWTASRRTTLRASSCTIGKSRWP